MMQSLKDTLLLCSLGFSMGMLIREIEDLARSIRRDQKMKPIHKGQHCAAGCPGLFTNAQGKGWCGLYRHTLTAANDALPFELTFECCAACKARRVGSPLPGIDARRSRKDEKVTALRCTGAAGQAGNSPDSAGLFGDGE